MNKKILSKSKISKPKYKILFVSSELHPFAKTGGLGDVCNSLPRALKALHKDIKILIPAYPFAIEKAEQIKQVAQIDLPVKGFPGTLGLTVETNKVHRVNILETKLPGTHVKVWMVESTLYNRPGTPYFDDDNKEWEDNDFRFALLNYIAVEIAMGRTELKWHADIVHSNDWQTGLISVLLEKEYLKKKAVRPATVFTIHNMAHMGVYSKERFDALKLPQSLWNHHELEFHNEFSFIKGGLIFSDRVNTVSPTYALEIQHEEFGYGLSELLAYRNERLSGILNGIDMKEWNPAKDPMIKKNYSIKTINNKQTNKSALQKHFNLPKKKNTLLLGLVARLVYQKGIDLLLENMDEILKLPVQIVILGSGDLELESRLRRWSNKHPDQLQLQIGYDEQLSHLIEAASDAFLMPSRFEPCGLNQLYSLRYGTIPIVRKTGGLADTVIHASKENLNNRSATGVVFQEAEGSTILDAVNLTSLLYQNKDIWKKLMINGMKQEFSWKESAKQYLALYAQAIEDRNKYKRHSSF
ncbi:MAG: glycogen synthase GlgA [gamma proteobacterium symbiont of Bathyaustriella thionipta]|nr:glycogen synthase GlgA [gamma proteobacterium symbiont of Bathyaustriella thionipta]